MGVSLFIYLCYFIPFSYIIDPIIYGFYSGGGGDKGVGILYIRY